MPSNGSNSGRKDYGLDSSGGSIGKILVKIQINFIRSTNYGYKELSSPILLNLDSK